MSEQPKEERGITKIAVSGFKSLRDESRIEIRNLTVLAGANSSGKSSIMQPLLLLKQTLEADADFAPLKLDGPIVQFKSADQFFFPSKSDERKFGIKLEEALGGVVENEYSKRKAEARLELTKTVQRYHDKLVELRTDMSHEEILRELPDSLERELTSSFSKGIDLEEPGWHVVQNRWILNVQLSDKGRSRLTYHDLAASSLAFEISRLIYVPGLRSGNYPYPLPLDYAENRFKGIFPNYVGRLIADWQEDDGDKYRKLSRQLNLLEMTSYIGAVGITELYVEIYVGRTLQSGKEDSVNITQVGLGVPQVLPVLVALLVAERGQLVYIEQPELHLHPRAQVKLAEIIADAASRGVRVVIETHSDLLILGIQTLVAEKKLNTDKVILHWFTRDENGVTKISPTTLDENGAFQEADWPEDFAEVRLDAQSRFLDAADIAELTSHNAE